MTPQAPPTVSSPSPLSPRAPRPLVAVMSSGFFGFFAHAGFLQGLADAGIRPDAYAGASSGALVAALAAAGRTPAEMMEGFIRLRKDDFWDPPRGWELIRLLLGGFKGRTGWLAGRGFQQVMARDLPVRNLEDCPQPCLIVALDAVSGQRVCFTRGDIATAVVASGTVPMLFAAVPHGRGLLVDGGLVDKAPLMAARRELGAASVACHLLTSSSLTKPASAMTGRRLTPLRLQARAVDAARQQAYEDQKGWLQGQGVPVWEVEGGGYTRVGPDRLRLGPNAFDEARAQTLRSLLSIAG